MAPAIVWFRRNLRLCDNPALAAAVASGRPLLPVYILDAIDTGGASRWWLHMSLRALSDGLEKHGGRLMLRTGDPVAELAALAQASGAESVYFQRRYESAARQQEQQLGDKLADDLELHGFDDALLAHPDKVMTQGGTPYKVFTPFWRSASESVDPARPAPAPASMAFADTAGNGLELDELDLLPTTPDWAGGLRETWTPGEDGAHARLDDLEDSVADYKQNRDRPDLDNTSRLSPHLHFGEISVRQAWHAVRQMGLQARSSGGAEALLRQLFWRDFSSYLLFHFPDLPDKPLRPEFADFPWQDDAASLSAWQHGRTGYPIVDAGMRQLWHSGFMHNRVRMLVASFLVKDLLIPWQQGAAWFLDTLVDADLGNNSAGWQWVAGCGTDAAPYFRIFNPTLQGKKFDPDGDYVRRWVPELRDLPGDSVHEPWKYRDELFGNDYPEPIVDHGAARDRALEAYRILKDRAKS